MERARYALKRGLILCPPGRCREENNFLFLPVITNELFGRSVRNLVTEVIIIEETAVFRVDFKIYSVLIVAFPGKVL
jgi:hypothetical protein